MLTRSVFQDFQRLARNILDVVVIREEVIQLVGVSMLAGGHLLLRDLPGIGKTLLAKSMPSSIDGTFKRIQCTLDLLPTDITGSSIFRLGEGRFEFVPGQIFANIVLADEVNWASPRTQSALLEAMAEGQVTVDGGSYRLPVPFWVVATQNEVDCYGTFPLPQAQQERFMMALSIGYPSTKEQQSWSGAKATGSLQDVLRTRIKDLTTGGPSYAVGGLSTLQTGLTGLGTNGVLPGAGLALFFFLALMVARRMRAPGRESAFAFSIPSGNGRMLVRKTYAAARRVLWCKGYPLVLASQNPQAQLECLEGLGVPPPESFQEISRAATQAMYNPQPLDGGLAAATDESIRTLRKSPKLLYRPMESQDIY